MGPVACSKLSALGNANAPDKVSAPVKVTLCPGLVAGTAPFGGDCGTVAARAEHRPRSTGGKSHSAAVFGSTSVRANEMELIRSREPWNPTLTPNVYGIFPMLPETLDDFGEGGIGFQKLGPWPLKWPFVDLEKPARCARFCGT